MKMQTQPAIDDKQILKRIASGDREALAELYARYQQHIFRYLLQLTPDYGLAEEMLQDTFVAVWKSASTFEGRSTVRTWLISITRRQAHNTLRRHKLLTVDEADLEELATTEIEPEDFTLNSIARDELTVAFKQLAPVHREIIVLIFIEELSYPEAANVLGIPVGTVKSRLSNAKRTLRTLLEHREGTQR
ncbi:MAG: sigma-70 family RNA polymerase sigma factor [Ktedonobacteraceae bacterium]